jgi:sulfur-carrier protein
VTSVVVRLAAPLRPLAGNRERLALEAPRPTVAGALEALGAVSPAARDRVVTEQGELRPHVNVFVGDESIRFTGGLATPVTDGAEIWILPAVSGG